MGDEMRMKEINWRRKEDQLLKEFQLQTEALNHENFALKSQLQATMDDLSKARYSASPTRSNFQSSPSIDANVSSQHQSARSAGGVRSRAIERDQNGSSVKLPQNVTEAEWFELKQQLTEQENLISGYQKENERLYEEIKMLKSEGGIAAKDKSATAAMFKENQKLLKEIGNLR